MRDRLGFIHVFFGKGVGKTTRAVGLALRAAGQGLDIDFVQFMKPGDSGEAVILKQIPYIHYHCPAGEHPFILAGGPEPIHFEHAQKALELAWAAVKKKSDLLICDEILNAILFKVLEKEQVMDLIDYCRNRVELVLTGREAPPEFIQAADYVTEFVEHKHPYYKGVKPRLGIEY